MVQKNINKSRLIRYLRLIKPSEIKSVHNYLSSTVFNTRNDVIQLFDYLIQNYPRFEAPVFRQTISETIYNTPAGIDITKKQDNKVRNLMSRLTNLIEEWFVFQKQQQETFKNKRLLIDCLIERGDRQLAQQKLNTFLEQLTESSYRNTDFYFHEYRLEESMFYLKILTQQRSKGSTVSPLIENFQYYSMTNLLIYYCVEINQQNTVGQAPSSKFLGPLLGLIRDSLEDFPVITKIYYHILHTLLKEEGMFHFKAALELANNNAELFTLTDKRHIYSFLNNFCSSSIRAGNLAFRKERYSIYKKCIDLKVWVTNSYFPSHHYMIHVKNMLYLDMIEEAHEFVYSQEVKLAENTKNSTVALCKGLISFFRGELDSTQDYLLLTEKENDYLHELYQKILWVQLFIANEELDIAKSNLQNLRAYLRPERKRNISKNVLKGFQKFTTLSLRLCHYLMVKGYNKNAPTLKKRLKEAVVSADDLYEREWLLGVLDLET